MSESSDAADTGSARRPRRRWRRLGLLGVAVVAIYLAVTFAMVWRADSWDETRRADAAVVLGAAQYDGRPSPAYRARLDHAAELYRAGTVRRVVVTGGRREGDRFTEAYAGLKHLIAAGVADRDVVVVDDGSSTWESLAASVRVLRRQGIRKVLLVSDSYHSLRLHAVAGEVGLDGKVSPVSTGGSSLGSLARETALVAAGRVIGYRRMVNLAE